MLHLTSLTYKNNLLIIITLTFLAQKCLWQRSCLALKNLAPAKYQSWSFIHPWLYNASSVEKFFGSCVADTEHLPTSRATPHLLVLGTRGQFSSWCRLSFEVRQVACDSYRFCYSWTKDYLRPSLALKECPHLLSGTNLGHVYTCTLMSISLF